MGMVKLGMKITIEEKMQGCLTNLFSVGPTTLQQRPHDTGTLLKQKNVPFL